MAVQGLWNPFGINLPDFGISEKLGIGPQNAAVSPSYGKLGVQGANTSNPSSLNNLRVGGGVSIPTTNTPAYTNYTPTGGGGGGNPNARQPGFTEEGNAIEADPYAQIRADISSAWDSYISSIQGIGDKWLPEQRTAQEGIASTQLQSGQEQIEGQRASSLRDIGSNIKNAFQAGNIYLGARGAGDSSAANQYQFALSKEAGKQSGALNEFVNTQKNQLQANYDTQMGEIAQWFANAQTQIQQQIASGQLSKSQDITNLSKDILNQALAYKQQIQQDASNRYNALVEWAASNSTNINQLTQNISQIPQAIGTPTVDSGGNIFAPSGFGFSNDEDRAFGF